MGSYQRLEANWYSLAPVAYMQIGIDRNILTKVGEPCYLLPNSGEQYDLPMVSISLSLGHLQCVGAPWVPMPSSYALPTGITCT